MLSPSCAPSHGFPDFIRSASISSHCSSRSGCSVISSSADRSWSRKRSFVWGLYTLMPKPESRPCQQSRSRKLLFPICQKCMSTSFISGYRGPRGSMIVDCSSASSSRLSMQNRRMRSTKRSFTRKLGTALLSEPSDEEAVACREATYGSQKNLRDQRVRVFLLRLPHECPVLGLNHLD